MSIFQGWMVESAPSYDNSGSLQCMQEPTGPLYNGGIIQNSEFNNGLAGWSVPWGVEAIVSTSQSGNKFAVSRSNGAKPSRTVFQKIQMQGNNHYAVAAWFQVPKKQVVVKASVKAPNGDFVVAGAVLVNPGCWTMLKGGMTAESSGPAELFFEVDDDAVDIMVDSVSLQPFSFQEWHAQRSLSTEKARRSSVKVVAQAADGKPLANATVNITLSQAGFPFGNAMTREILDNPAYEEWFTSRFTVTTFENEMKWYSTERSQNHEDYSAPDAMLKMAQKHGIKVRGHNVFWDDAKTQMEWVKPMNPAQLSAAMQRRVRSLVTRYAGKVIAWDVVNENLHYDFFESKLGPDASPRTYQQVGQLDGSAMLFMNEFGTLEEPVDTNAMATRYAAKMGQIRAFAGNGGLKLAVGLESHFTRPNIPYMRAVLDTLSQLGIPIWLTEVDVAPGPMQAAYLEEVLREGYAHPSVQGIVMWAAWHAKGCYVMCLTDNNFRNLPVGDVVDKLIAEWRTHTRLATTNANGMVEVDLVHGEYNVTLTHPSLNAPAVHTVTVNVSSSEPDQTIDIKL
ncbi:hypothetical protein QOZ80_2AG0121490 [Eleusine coracana subsp. coracana]|nr:hypothetical protein QOZ80_2AG0121490 [Eleusine coracana subsp. coracana]